MNVSVLTISPRVTRSMTRLHRNSLTITDDLVLEIFSRLPLKAIARCRCVCKLWSSMLRSEDFADFFFTKSCARPQLLFALGDDTEMFFFSSPQPHNPEENSYVVATTNHHARFPGRDFCCTSGFLCNGVTMIMHREVDTLICNPITGQSLTLPRLKSRRRKRSFVTNTYHGYDPISKTFKVLSMVTLRVGNELNTSVDHKVVTLGTKKLSWRMVECCIPHRPCYKWICINGVLYYMAAATNQVERSNIIEDSMIVCFDFRTEKFSVIDLSTALRDSVTMINYNGKLGLLMSGDSRYVSGASKSLELWVLQEAEWSKHVYVLPPSWEDVVAVGMRIAGMVGANEIVLAPWFHHVPSYVIYFNVESKKVTKVGIRGMEAFQGNRFITYLNFVENVKLI